MSSAPARFLVQEFFRVTGRGTVAVGVLSAGTVSVGEVLRVESTGGPVVVRGVELHGVVPVPGGQRIAFVLAPESLPEVAVGDVLVGERPPVGTDAEIAAQPAPGTDPVRERRHALMAARARSLGALRVDVGGPTRAERRQWLEDDVAAAEADMREAGTELQHRAAARLLERARRAQEAEQEEVRLEALLDGWVALAQTWRRARSTLPASSPAAGELADREAALLGLLGLPWPELLVRLRIGDLPAAGEGPDPWALREGQLSGRSGRVVVPGTQYLWTAPHLQGPDGRVTAAFAGAALRGGRSGGWRPVPSVWEALVAEDQALPDAELGWDGGVLVHGNDRWPDWRVHPPEVPQLRGGRWRALDPGETADRVHRWPAPAGDPDPLGAPYGLDDEVPRPVRPLGGLRIGGPPPVADLVTGAVVLPDGRYAEWQGYLHPGAADWRAEKEGRAANIELLSSRPLADHSTLNRHTGWRTRAPAHEVTWWDLRSRCRWGPDELEPLAVTGGLLSVGWSGGNGFRAVERGMQMVDRGVYVGSVPLEEVTDLRQERSCEPA